MGLGLEIIAGVFVVSVFVKLFFLIFNPRYLIKVAKKLSDSHSMGVIYLVLAALVFYFLVEDISPIELIATAGFVSLLFRFQFFRYSKDFDHVAERIVKNKRDFWIRNWLYVLIWVALAVWAAVEIII